MCQGVLCDCCWYNCLGILTGGCSTGMLCCGWWCCQKDDMLEYKTKDECCTMLEQSGCGGNFCFIGCFFCAPVWLRTWSIRKKSFYK